MQNINSAATLEEHLAVSYKTKPILTTSSNNCPSRCLPKGIEKLYPHKNLHNTASLKLIESRLMAQRRVGEWRDQTNKKKENKKELRTQTAAQ